MKLTDVYGREISIDVSHRSYPPRTTHRSNRQMGVFTIIKEIYPSDIVLEEFTIPGSRMSLDFFIPSRRLAIEVQGEQHIKFIKYFHGNRAIDKSFAEQKMRDASKNLWCENNKIRLVEIFPCDTDDEVREKIIWQTQKKI